MIDTHTHILPGIDDGVETDEEAIEFARMAHADGTRTIVATPHCKEGFYENDRDTVVAAVEKLRPVLAAAQVEIELLPGAEVHICPELVERVRDGRAPTLADNGKTLLLELSLRQHPVGLEDLVFQLKLAELQVVFAHPERIRYFQDDEKRYAEVVRMGAWGQVTSGSLRGTFGSTAREFAERWTREGLIHVIASDAHNCRGRHPRMAEAVEAAAELVGEARAQAMVQAAPQALIEGRSPDLPPVEDNRPSRGGGSFFSRLFQRNSKEARR